MRALISIAEEFKPKRRITDIREFGNGNINNTFLVSFETDKEKGGNPGRFILQRVNTQVFRAPELVMRNMRIATAHIFSRLQGNSFQGRRWEVPELLQTRDGSDYFTDAEGAFWRAQSFIEDARSFDIIKNTFHAGEAGYALGFFHKLLSDLPDGKLSDTLPGFHITPVYLRSYNEVLPRHKSRRSPEVDYCTQFVNSHTALARVLEDAKAAGKLRVRPIHGDPKVNNILLDTATDRAVSIIDLDTVKPGLVHYDIGDFLRSGCNPAGEETTRWEEVRFDPDLCRAALRGYFSSARESLTAHDLEFIYECIRLIAFELGLRFFTDYLQGNVYFKVKSPEHNLQRALVQFRLTQSIESQERSIRSVIQGLE